MQRRKLLGSLDLICKVSKGQFPNIFWYGRGMLNFSDYLRVMNCSFHSCERQKEVGSLFAWFSLQNILQEECNFSWLS